MNKQLKNKELQNIKKVWSKIEYVLNNKSWNKYGTEYLKQQRSEARNHIGFKPDSVRHGLTITEESKFFAVLRISEYLYSNNSPSLTSFMHTNKSVFMAYALADEFRKELKDILSIEEAEHYSKLDYCEFAKVF